MPRTPLQALAFLAGLGHGGGAAAAPPASGSAVTALRDFLGSRFGYLPTRVAEGVVVTRVERVYEDRLRVHLEDGRSYEVTVVEWVR